MRKKIAILILIILLAGAVILLVNPFHESKVVTPVSEPKTIALTSTPNAVTFISTAKVKTLLEQETEAENLWKSKGISNYYIEVKNEFVSPYEDTQIHKITVKNLVVVAHDNTCEKSRVAIDSTQTCKGQPINPEICIVPGLFALARIADKSSDNNDPGYQATINYENNFGYPVKISSGTSTRLHSTEIWTVEKFQILN